ncbi:glutamate-5-semialdehyde dehydrogenase [Savagea sp. SN6]|uniref:Gamma-glutamyl phosphate reductase n=2 Tax=Savagea serpentis TaxID=2785297 RepID=A0A8J7GBX2_9BACL|nr:glutamate-5-semialdehyde dehydrogenase [Savagea serpentis]
MIEIGQLAKKASQQLAQLTEEQTNEVLRAIASQLEEDAETILAANAQDMAQAEKDGIEASVQDRMLLTEDRLADMIDAVREIAKLPTPIGNVLTETTHAQGMSIEKTVVPLGVVAMIYEARPNVTVDAAALTFKTNNAVILRGSSSVLKTNMAMINSIQRALIAQRVDEHAIQLLTNTSYEFADQLLTLNGYVDVIIPRGGQGLIQNVVKKATVPVIETGAGNCHLFIDEEANPSMALNIALNAKLQRTSVCNAIETILLHEKFDASPLLAELQKRNVRIYADDADLQGEGVQPVAGWDTEFLNESVRLKRVASVEEAIEHINRYGTKHSEAIITENIAHANQFLQSVDASTVYHNVSTRFTDGFEFGFGAEIGISTQKLHARGPMGLDALTSTKYIVRGNGQTRG